MVHGFRLGVDDGVQSGRLTADDGSFGWLQLVEDGTCGNGAQEQQTRG